MSTHFLCVHEMKDGVCLLCGKSPHPTPSPQENSWEQRFDDEFTYRGDFGERKFSLIRPNRYTRHTPIVLEDQIIPDLKAFIRQVELEARRKERENIRSIAERHRYRAIVDPNPEAHAFNEALDLILQALDTAGDKQETQK